MSFWKDWYKSGGKERLVVKLGPEIEVSITPILNALTTDFFKVNFTFKGMSKVVRISGRDHVLVVIAKHVRNWTHEKFDLLNTPEEPDFFKYEAWSLNDDQREYIFQKLDQLLIS